MGRRKAAYGFGANWIKTGFLVSHRLIMGKLLSEDSDFIYDRSFVKLAGNECSHKISDEFDFGPDRTIHFGVTRP